MNQGRRLECLADSFLSEFLGRELAQLVIDQRQKLARGLRISALDCHQDSSYVVHAAQDNRAPKVEQTLPRALPDNAPAAVRWPKLTHSSCSHHAEDSPKTMGIGGHNYNSCVISP